MTEKPNQGFQTLLFTTEPGRQDYFVQKMLEYQVEAIIMAMPRMVGVAACQGRRIARVMPACGGFVMAWRLRRGG